MRDLEALKNANEAENVGDKLGEFNGNTIGLQAQWSNAFWANRRAMNTSKKPWQEPDPINPYEPISPRGPLFSSVLERYVG